VLPRANVPDLREIPGELARRIEFVPVETLDEALDAVLERPLAPARGSGRAAARRRPAEPGRAPVATAKGR
jgi:predicted ATP-dependent protease